MKTDNGANDIPDPEVDFEGCLKELAERAATETLKLVPRDLDPIERLTRFVASSGARYIGGIKRQQSGFWPQLLIDKERELFHRRVVELAALLEAKKREGEKGHSNDT